MPQNAENLPADEPSYVLFGSVHRGYVDLGVASLVVIAVTILVTLISTVFESTFTATLVTFGITVLILVVMFRAMQASRPALVIYANRVVVASRRGAAGCTQFVFPYEDLVSTRLNGRSIVFRLQDAQPFSFRGDWLHVEDAFDILKNNIEAANPECMILNDR